MDLARRDRLSFTRLRPKGPLALGRAELHGAGLELLVEPPNGSAASKVSAPVAPGCFSRRAGTAMRYGQGGGQPAEMDEAVRQALDWSALVGGEQAKAVGLVHA
jgi:hypothetical protein